jgi:phosphatidylserine/phosphatidylglycerophosphate/cardiolipin synthase-like enzyme
MFESLRRGSSNSYGYSGSDTHKYIDELINDNAKILKVITPYLGISYARTLVHISTRKRIYLIVSGDSTKKDEEAVRFITKKGRHVDIKPVIYGSIIAIGIALAGVYPLALSIGILLAVYIYRAGIYLPKHRNITVKIATNKFIHEKMYISEGSAIVGSANLTYSGTHKNIEHIEVIKEHKKVKELEEHFDNLWKKY